MGQATANLPDPTQDLTNAHAGGADDLLAQLAGDEIDRLLAESDVEPVAVVKAAAVVADAPVAAAVQANARVAAVEPPAAVEIPHASEIAAVLDHSEPAQGHDVEHVPAMRPTAVTPLWLKPLVWLNAPLDAIPESLRDLVGKVAIATTANAVAVLGYVALFRRHH